MSDNCPECEISSTAIMALEAEMENLNASYLEMKSNRDAWKQRCEKLAEAARKYMNLPKCDGAYKELKACSCHFALAEYGASISSGEKNV